MTIGGIRMPDVPMDVPYPQLDDVFAAALLEANGVTLDDGALIEALGSPVEVVRGAAARTLGARGTAGAAAQLAAMASAGDGTDRAEAAYALVRLGETDQGTAALRACLDLPADWAIAAIQAAGMLARLGDPSGAPVVLRALRSTNSILQTVAAKQLYFLVPFDGNEVDGEPIDAAGALETLARGPDEEIARLAQLEIQDLDRE